MSKQKKQKDRPQPKEMIQAIYKPETGCFHFKGYRISIATVESFFGLGALGTIMRIHLDDDNKVQIDRVPEGIACYYAEVSRILKKYADDPKRGFEEIKRTTFFAENVAAKDPEKPFGQDPEKHGRLIKEP